MKMIKTHLLITVALMANLPLVCQASEYYMPPMPMSGPYQQPVYPMMQQPQPMTPAPQQDRSTSSKQPGGSLLGQISAMQEQQQQMQQHLQRIERHLANIERLIRQLVENR